MNKFKVKFLKVGAIYMALLIFSLLKGALLFAQIKPLKFEKISAEDGLSQSTVLCILKDTRGYMWFGTALGLNRYDGYKIKSFIKNQDDSTSLLSNYISCLYEDKDSNLWVGTLNGGINRFNRDKETFETLHVASHDPGVQSILCIYEDPAGNIFFGTNGAGIIFLDKRTGKTKIFKSNLYKSNIKESNIIRDYFYYNKKLYIGTLAGIQTVDAKGEFKKITQRVPEDSKVFKCFYQTLSGEIWIATEMGLGKLSPDGNWNNITYPYPGLVNFFINDLVEDENQNLWVATTGKGLAIINKQRDKISYHKRNIADPSSINNDDLISTYRDDNGIIWIGGYGGGINKYDNAKNKFLTYRNEFSDNITGLFESIKGDIWFVNGYSGVSKFSPKTNKIYNYNNPHYYYYQISEDAAGNIWATHPQLGLSKFSETKQKFEFALKIPIRNSVTRGADGKLYLGTYEGLISVDPMTNTTQKIFSPQVLKNISSISQTTNSRLIIGGANGKVAEYNLATKSITIHNLEYGSGKINEIIPSVIEDRAGRFWVSLAGRGLLLYDKKTKKGLKLYNTQNGLPSKEVVSIIEDNSGKIWVATMNGMAKLDPLNDKINTYTTQDGLVHSEFNPQVAFKNSKGNIYFGGMEGFDYFNPDDIVENKKIPPVVLTDFLVFNKSVPIGSSKPTKGYFLPAVISRTKQIELSHYQNVFSLEFAALNFSLTAKNKYAYKMEGFDKEWIYSGTNRTATYTNLNPGQYTFRVKAANNDGIWNEKGTSVILIIHPPLWRTWWAYVLYVIFSILLFYVIWKYFTHREKLQNELKLKRLESKKLQEVDALKTRFYTNVSHEFRTPLTLILGPLETALSLAIANGEKEIRRNLEMVNRNAHRLLELINQLMDFSKIESGNMKLYLQEADLISFLRTCTLSFSSLAVSKGIALQFITTSQQLITSFDKDKLEKIVNNLLSNALKFTRQGGSVEVFVDNTKSDLVLQITDDGIGIPEDKFDDIFNRYYQVDDASKTYEGTGIGLALLKELVAFHNGSIHVQSSENKGSVFTVKFPIEIKHVQKSVHSEKNTFHAGSFANYENGDVNSLYANHTGQVITNGNHFDGKVKDANKERPIILIVEDNHEIRSYIKSAFGEEYIILESENGKLGLAIAEKNIPDLVITDIMMPEMDGQELCNILKTNEKTSHIPVIMLTAKASQESKIEGFLTGADDYIIKPFFLKELQVRAKNLIEQREKLRKRFSREVTLHPKEIAITSADENFLNKCIAIIEKNMSNSEFTVDEFGRDVGMSRSQLHRKLKALIDQSASEFIRNIRLKRAAELIKKKYGNTAEVAYEVGFNSVSYFIKCYKEVYGKTPSEIIK